MAPPQSAADTPEATPEDTLAERLRRAVQAHAEQVAQAEGVRTLRLRDLLQLHGDDSAAVLLLVLAVLCVTPVAGVGTVVGLVMLAIAWHWGGAQRRHPLPERLAAVTLNERWTRRCLHGLAWLYARSDRHLRPRWTVLFHRAWHLLWGLWIALLALLIMLPLPLGNVLPATSLVLLSLAWLFRDGLVLAVSALPGLAGWGIAVWLGDVVWASVQRGLAYLN